MYASHTLSGMNAYIFWVYLHLFTDNLVGYSCFVLSYILSREIYPFTG